MAGLEDTELYVEIARAGGFAAAQASTGLERSVLSRRLARLERRLGAQLAKRSPQGFALTPAGEQLVEACAGALERVRKAEAALAERQTTPSGLVRITAPAPIAHVFLAEEVDVFLARHPEVSVAIDVTGQKAALRDEPFDLALRVGEVADDSLVARRLFIECEAVYASSRWVERHGLPATPADLKDHRVVRCARSDAPMSDVQWRLTDTKEEVEVSVLVRVTVSDAVAAREIVAHGDLLGSLPRSSPTRTSSKAASCGCSQAGPARALSFARFCRTSRRRPPAPCSTTLSSARISAGERGDDAGSDRDRAGALSYIAQGPTRRYAR